MLGDDLKELEVQVLDLGREVLKCFFKRQNMIASSTWLL